MGKNFFEKLGLVEAKDKESVSIEEDDVDCTPEVAINIEKTAPSTLVQDAYLAQGISDTSKSVYKVEEFINAMPSDMPNKTKQSSVLGILTVSGMNANDIIVDADVRVATLTGALETVVNENKKIVDDANLDIENLKQAIENANHVIADKEGIIKHSENIIAVEVERINKLKEFVGGM